MEICRRAWNDDRPCNITLPEGEGELKSSEAVSFNRTIVVSVLLAASFVSLLNQTLLIVAIPPIMEEFMVGPNQAQWVTTAFMLMNGIMIPITAFLIEKFGSRVLLLAALSIFSVGTLLGGLAPNFNVLLIARIVQAVGAGILMPLMQTIILTLYPIEKRGTAMGVSGLVIGFAPAIGPTLGGWIIDQFAWRYLFYTVLPISLIVLVLAMFLMKNVTEKKEILVDILSIILSTFGWGGLLYAFSIVGSTGWTNPNFIGALIIGSIALALFIRRQQRLETPILNFSVFQSKQFTITTILSVLMFAVLIGGETLLPMFVQEIRGGTAMSSGMILLPGALVTGFMSPISGRIFDKFGARGMVIIGFVFMLVGTTLYINIGPETSLNLIAVLFVIKMFGMSLLMMPLMTAGINALKFELIAHGTAMQSTIRMVGGSIGTALIISVMSNSSKASGISMEGMQAGFSIAAIMVLIGLALSFTLEKRSKLIEKTDVSLTNKL